MRIFGRRRDCRPREAGLLSAMLIAAAGLPAAAQTAAGGAHLYAEAVRGAEPKLYAGGVAGITDLLDPSHSLHFRAEGGGLYLHNTGWMKLSWQQQDGVLEIFRGAPIAIELGFGSGAAWGNVYKQNYLAHGVKPVFIAANAFANNGRPPTLEQWRSYRAGLREYGVPQSSLILPTFEYQNFTPDMATLTNNRVSASPLFQAIIATAGGIVLDTPPGYAMGREEAYRDWVIDAVRWATQRRMTSVVILSPFSSGRHWGNDTDRYVRYLSTRGGMPSAFVCENYIDPAPPNYLNRVGLDSLPYTAIGNCDLLKDKVLPSLRQ